MNARIVGGVLSVLLLPGFVAVEEQLGLKLVRDARGSVEYVIIAPAHAPTEN